MVEVVVEREKKKQLTLTDRTSLYFMVWSEVIKSGHTHGLSRAKASQSGLPTNPEEGCRVS